MYKIHVYYIASLKFLKVIKNHQLLNCKASFGGDTYNKSIRDAVLRVAFVFPAIIFEFNVP